ncbi:MAG TPA: hypothetical protein VMF89_26075, partial [Polyangiales bacterium]|nr:hypothetical protein [Polyangiales bacterium]
SIEHVGSATITLPQGDARAAEAKLSLLGLELDALIPPAELNLFSKRWLLVDGYVWAQPNTPLEWRRASRGRVEFALRLPGRVTAAHAAPQGAARCSDLALEPDADNGRTPALIREKATRAVWMHWRAAESVPLSRFAGGPAVAWLDTRPDASNEAENEDDEPEQAIVLERRGASARVAYLLESTLVVGWVPLTAFEIGSEQLEDPRITLINLPTADWSRPTTPYGADDPAPLRNDDSPQLCAWNAPLAVEVEGSLRRVGKLASGIPLFPSRSRGGLREVTFSHPALELTDTARFWVPEQLLYQCGAPR